MARCRRARHDKSEFRFKADKTDSSPTAKSLISQIALCAVAILPTLGFAPQARAQALSVHFGVGQPNTTIAAAAGAFGATNWNNIAVGATSLTNPTLSDGSTGTGISLSFPSFGNFTFTGGGYSGGFPGTFGGTSGTSSGFNSLYRSNIDPRGGTAANAAAIRITGLSSLPQFAGGYTILVYMDGNNGTANRIGEYSVYSGSNTTPDQTLYALDAGGTAYTDYFQSTATSIAAATAPGNYVAFSGLTADAVTISSVGASASDGILRAPINGIQVVPNSLIPEPSSGSLLLMALVACGIMGAWNTTRTARSSPAVERATTRRGTRSSSATPLLSGASCDAWESRTPTPKTFSRTSA